MWNLVTTPIRVRARVRVRCETYNAYGCMRDLVAIHDRFGNFKKCFITAVRLITIRETINIKKFPGR